MSKTLPSEACLERAGLYVGAIFFKVIGPLPQDGAIELTQPSSFMQNPQH